MRRVFVPFLSLVCVIGWQVKAVAHGVTIQHQSVRAYEIEATYDTGEPMVDAQVAVFSPDNPVDPWLIGTTDASGRFLFSPSSPGNWEVQVRQAGHGDVVVIPVETVAIAAAPAAPESTRSVLPAAPTGAIASTTLLQKGVMIGSVVWGCIGTALFFARGRERRIQGNTPLNRDAHS